MIGLELLRHQRSLSRRSARSISPRLSRRQRTATLRRRRCRAGRRLGLRGHAAVLAETWHRYSDRSRLPRRISGARERSRCGGWARPGRGAHAAAAQGVDVRAVTAWALLGSWDWDSLLTRANTGHYEAGAFDVRTDTRRPTALATVVELAAGRASRHPVLDGPRMVARDRTPCRPQPTGPMLITGAAGTLGRAFVQACEARGLRSSRSRGPTSTSATPRRCGRAVARWRPWAIVNAAGYVRVDDAEREPPRAAARTRSDRRSWPRCAARRASSW